MQKETLIIRKEAEIQPCLAWIKELLALHGALEVTVSTEGQGRSIKQHRLYWLWNTEIGNHLGLLKDEVHEMLKRKFAVLIFTRDDSDYAEMIAAVKLCRKKGMGKVAESLAKKITTLTSTTDFKVDQMREYLTDIEHYAAEIGAELTFPEDLYGSVG
ncbi:hypothetical protein KAR91_11855 [Candidatus Pacearchaeota archaeon]|nr:hypothetical protein [Candidatus Pacearchaeota archaeon]